MANIDRHALNKLLTVISGIHPTSYSQLYTNETSFGFSSTFNKVRGNVSVDDVVKTVSNNKRLEGYDVEGYHRDKNIVLRFYKSEDDRIAARSVPRVPVRSDRLKYRREFMAFLDLPKYHYSSCDAYASRRDWVVVFYNAAHIFEFIKQKLANSPFHDKVTVHANNQHVYITILNANNSKEPINPVESVVMPINKPNQFNETDKLIADNFDVCNFVNDVLREATNKSLAIGELSDCLTWCSELAKSETVNIDLVNKLANLVGKRVSIKLV